MPKAPEPKAQKTRIQKGVLVLFCLLCTVTSIGICLWLLKDELQLPQLNALGKKHQPQPELYRQLQQNLTIQRDHLSQQYQTATTSAQKDTVLAQAQSTLESELPKMMRCWLGTRWDFNGHCETPGSGEIACGYYVATVLRDAGFNLHRIKLAQQPSQTILGAFVPRGEMTIRTGTEYHSYWQWLEQQSPGIYIIGLDKHVGFLVKNTDSLHFLHSSGSAPWCVVDETQNNAKAIENSNYRVIGNLTANEQTLKNWLTQQRVYPN